MPSNAKQPSITPGLEAHLYSIKDKFNNSLIKWWRLEGRNYPWRGSDVSPYEILVAEILLKRTTATAAAKTYLPLLEMCPDIPALAAVDTGHLECLLVNVGLQKQRAKGFKEIAHYILVEEGGNIPRSLDGLLKVPHIGDYVARAVLSFAFKAPYGVVDSNVVRVLNCVFNQRMQGRNDLRTCQAIIDILLPRRRHKEFNWGLLDLGAIRCHYIKRSCEQCPIGRWCGTCRLQHH